MSISRDIIFNRITEPIEVMQVTSQALVRWSLSRSGRKEEVLRTYCPISILSLSLLLSFYYNFHRFNYQNFLTVNILLG